MLPVAEDVRLAVAVDVALGPEELDRRRDDARDEQHQQDEGAQHHDAREQAALPD